MVGEKGNFQCVVAESLVYCVPYWREWYLVAAFLKNGFQTIGLMQVVGKEHEFVTLVQQSFEILAHKVEIFVEQWLQRCVELYFCACAYGLWAQLPMLCALGIALKLVGCHQFGHLGQFVVRQLCLQGETFVVELVNASFDKCDILCYENGILWQELCYCNSLAAVELGNNGRFCCALL